MSTHRDRCVGNLALKNNQKISAQRQRKRDDGPSAFILARKAEILNDVIVQRKGKAALNNHNLSDCVDALSYLFSKGAINEFEPEAGEKMARIRRSLFGFGVVPPPSFYARMCVFEPDPEAKRYDNREALTDEQKLERAAEQLEEYETAMKYLNAGGVAVRMAVQRVCQGDWWPEKVDDFTHICKGLGILAVKWGIGVASMPSDRPTICLDFDGVIHSYKSGWKGATVIPDAPVEGTMEFLARTMEVFNIAIHSSRSHQEGGIRAMRDYLAHHLNQFCNGDRGRAWALLSRLQFPTFKPAAIVSIDDRALCFTGKWDDFDPLKLASFKPWYAK